MNCGHIAVLIPARNEELLIARCLHSVLAAASMLPLAVTCDVIVVSDSSSDATAEIACAVLGAAGSVVRIDVGSVGAARSVAAEMALKRYGGNLSHCWLANTDADTEVPPTWLLDHYGLALQDADAVAGIVDVDCFAEHQPHVEARFRLTYRIHPDGTHPHVHGANLGVRASAYEIAGGWGDLSTAEDHDLWHRLQNGGAVCRSVAALKVVTSGRRIARAPFGFADALSAHNDALVATSEAAA